MPEALAILAVFAVAIAAWVGALLHARDPANQNPTMELARLREQQFDLSDRVQLAQRERWSREMIESLSSQLAQVTNEIEARTAGATNPQTAA